MTTTPRSRFRTNHRLRCETVSPPTVADLPIVQRDDGQYQLGIP
jgi:hypothetical protein